MKTLWTLLLLMGFGVCWGQFVQQEDITRCKACGIKDIAFVDIDNDGKKDIVSVSIKDNKVAWYKNLGWSFGQYLFSEQMIISNRLNQASFLNYADLNNDGWVDIISTSKADSKIVWYENMGGVFSEEKSIAILSGSFSEMYIDDYDNDSYVDIVADIGNQILIYRNTGDEAFDELSLFQEDNILSKKIFLQDANNDGNKDIIIVSSLDKKVYKYENMGQGAFDDLTVLLEFDDYFPQDIVFEDIDNDGYADFLYSSNPSKNIIVWRKNNGANDYLPPQVIIQHSVTISSFYVLDFDEDGKIDIEVLPEI